ncbi:MAG TPA: transglutaminase-like domain-containing protein [archaeon]|nr:transglutaminase-like domain-containing protein [archaeon]
MKKNQAILFVGFVLLLSTTAFGIEFRPATVKNIDVTITTQALGNFSGEITRGDELEILYLSIQKDESQEIVSLNEHMEIGNDTIEAEHFQQNGLTYAKYVVKDLLKYKDAPEFKVIREARVKKEAKIGLNADYNLNNEINEFSEYKKETEYIESNDVELKSKASLEFSSESQIESIREIAEWVNTNIEYDFDKYYNGVYSAKETYQNRAGVCDEFANLTAAFTRIKGMPTKYVTGLSFDGERFGMHGWLEVYLPQTGWIGVDSTYGEAGYLDAAHITFAKTTDANNAVDFIATTKTRKTIQVNAELPLPETEINSVEFFQNILEAEIETPDAVQSGEKFEVKAKIKNISNENAILPIELRFHEDFGENQNNRLVYFEAGEEKEIVWGARAPEKEIERGYYNYGMMLLLPDGNVLGTIKIVSNKTNVKEEADIRVNDVSPLLNGEDLEIQIELENLGQKDGNALIEVFFDGNPLQEKTVEVNALEKKTVSYIVRRIHSGTVTVKITGAEEKNYEIKIPETQQGEVVAEEINGIETEMPETGALEIPEFTQQELLQMAGAGVIALVIITALVFMRK